MHRHRLDNAALAGDAAVLVERYAGMGGNPLVDQRVARPAVEGDGIAGFRHEGDVGYAADIDEGDRQAAMVRRKGTGKRDVIGRHKRRALPAVSHVVGAHVVDHVDACPFGQQRAVTELDR